jgi:hypothetical protein
MNTPPPCNRKIRKRRFQETAFKGAMGERSGKGSNLDASHIILRTREITCQFQESTRDGALKESSGKGPNLAAISLTAKYGRSNVSSRKIPATGRWKNVPGNVQISSQSHVSSLIVMDLGVDEGDGCSRDVNTTTLQQHSKGRSGKLPATGRWKNVPGKVRFSLKISLPEVHGRYKVSSGNLPAAAICKVIRPFPERGDGEAFRERFKSRCISQTAKHGRSNVSSRKLPAMGRWKNVPGKVQISLQSHPLPNMGDHTLVPGNFPQQGDGGTFRERFKSRCNLTHCQTWEITRQFQETSHNGAMEERSKNGSNLEPISLRPLDCCGFGCW